MDWLLDNAADSYRSFPVVDELPEDDKRRLICLDPKRIKQLLQTRDVSKLAKYFHYADDLASIRRSVASELLKNEHGETVSMREMMPRHQVLTVDLQWQREEGLEYQVVHRAHARRYIRILKNWYAAREEKSSPAKSSFPGLNREIRQMVMANTSVLLSRLDRMFRRCKWGTDVYHVNTMRKRGLLPTQFLDMVHRDDDPDLTNGLKYAEFLSYGSPKVRYLVHMIKMVIFGQTQSKQKLLITEELPISALFWELACQLLHVECAVLHSEMNDSERIEVVRDFNNPKHPLKILVITYHVTTQGVNLDESCSRVLVMTPAANGPVEIQSWGRVIRVSKVLHTSLRADTPMLRFRKTSKSPSTEHNARIRTTSGGTRNRWKRLSLIWRHCHSSRKRSSIW